MDRLTVIIRNRLKRIQYRPALIEGFLAQTGLTLEPQPLQEGTSPDHSTSVALRLRMYQVSHWLLRPLAAGWGRGDEREEIVDGRRGKLAAALDQPMNPARWRRGPALFLALAGCFAAGLAGAVPVQAQTCVLRYYWNADGSASWNSRPVNTVDCGMQLAMTRGNGTTEIATIDTSGNLDYYWNVDGSPNWTSGQIGNGSWTTEPPAITRFSNGTEIAVTAGNEFHYYWNIDGSNTWNLSTVGPALLTVGPAITRSGNATGIVGLSAPNTLTYYWNADGSPNWSAELISTQAAQGLYGFPPDAAVGGVGRHQGPDRSISTWKGTVALISPVNISPSRYRLLAESSR